MIQRPRGTRDLLPPETRLWQAVERVAQDVFGAFGGDEIRTPIFESTELFVRSVGESTDIVHKEMYTFPDRKGRSLTLRPEGTAGVARAWIENSLNDRSHPLRLYYIGPMFRYERMQAG
ncbi:MAG: histidine--tRNA ligase, partial [Acidobacteria bacterium]|nr:histidine--tRNA ligase [Acidobacteriota bacterium]